MLLSSSSSCGSSSEASNSSLRSSRIVLLLGAGVTAAEEDEEEDEEVEDPATLTLRASGVYRLIARFFRVPLPRFSSALSGSSLTQEFERSVVEEEEEPKEQQPNCQVKSTTDEHFENLSYQCRKINS